MGPAPLAIEEKKMEQEQDEDARIKAAVNAATALAEAELVELRAALAQVTGKSKPEPRVDVQRPALGSIIWVKQWAEQEWQVGIVTGVHATSPIMRVAMVKNGSNSIVSDTWSIVESFETLWRWPERG